jgi:YVTN family beta-propeller protein
MKRFSFRTKALLMAGIVYGVLLAILSCGKKKTTEPVNPTDNFSTEVLPILQARCNTSGCHGGQTASDSAGGLVFSSFDAMRLTVGQKTSWAKPLIIPGNPDSSHLVLTIRQSRSTIMPPSPLPALPDTEINKIVDWIKQGAKGPGSKKFPTYREGKVYVANSNDGRVDVIDLSTNYKTDSILTYEGSENPASVQTHHIAISPDKKFVYVTNAWSLGHIVKIDAEKDSVVGRVRAGFQPADIALSPDGQFIYTTDYTLGRSIMSVVRRFNAQTLTFVDTFLVGQAPHGVAIGKDGNLVIAPGQYSDDCWLIYPAGDSTLRVRLSVGIPPNPLTTSRFYGPFGAIFSKNDSLAYISCIDSTQFHPNHQIRIVNTTTRQVSDIDSILLDPLQGRNPYMMTLSKGGDTLYAACWGGNTVAVIELATKSVTYIPVGIQAHAPALVADSLLYVTCEGNHVSPYKVYVVNTITKTVVDSIDVGRYPNGIAVLKP